jgi:DNA-binding NarL/FixJ family response regulator
METIQLTISNKAYATALRDLLARNPGWKILVTDRPDPQLEGVMVLDSEALERLPAVIARPERIVLITRKDAPHLAKAWEAGIVSVVYENEPVNTALLAVMAARLRVSKGARADGSAGSSPAANHDKVNQGTPQE